MIVNSNNIFYSNNTNACKIFIISFKINQKFIMLKQAFEASDKSEIETEKKENIKNIQNKNADKHYIKPKITSGERKIKTF